MDGLKHDIFKMYVSCMDLYAVCFTIYLKKGYFCFDRKSILLLQGNHYHTIRLAEDEDWTFYLFNSREDYEKEGKKPSCKL